MSNFTVQTKPRTFYITCITLFWLDASKFSATIKHHECILRKEFLTSECNVTIYEDGNQLKSQRTQPLSESRSLAFDTFPENSRLKLSIFIKQDTRMGK